MVKSSILLDVTTKTKWRRNYRDHNMKRGFRSFLLSWLAEGTFVERPELHPEIKHVGAKAVEKMNWYIRIIIIRLNHD